MHVRQAVEQSTQQDVAFSPCVTLQIPSPHPVQLYATWPGFRAHEVDVLVTFQSLAVLVSEAAIRIKLLKPLTPVTIGPVHPPVGSVRSIVSLLRAKITN